MTTDQRGSATSGMSRPPRRVGARPPAGHAGLLRGAGHFARHRLGDLLVEHARNDVLGTELASHHARGDGVGGGQLHLVVDEARPDVEEAAEKAGEAEHVVDLVRVVAPSRGHHPHMAEGFFRLYLGYGIGHGEDDTVPRHALEVPQGQGPGHRQADENVRVACRVSHLAFDLLGIGRLADPRLHEVHTHRPPPIDRAVLVHADDVLHAQRLQHLDHGGAGGAHSTDHDFEAPGLLFDDLERVEERRDHDHGRAVLVVVKHRDVELLAQPGLDIEAARRRDVLQVDTAEGWGDQLDRLDDLVGVLGVEADGEGVYAGQFLEEHGLALHDGHGRFGTDVAQPEDCRAVGDHGYGVLLDREREGPLGILLDGLAHPRHPGRIGHGEVVPCSDRHLTPDFDLAAQVHQESTIRNIGDLDSGEGPEPVDDALGVLAIPRLDRDVSKNAVPRHLDQVDGPDIAACLSDEHGDAPEHAGAVQDRQAYGEAVGSAGGDGHQCGSRKIPVIYELFTIGPLVGPCQSNSRASFHTPN